MSVRFVDYWENYAMPHDDKAKEFLDTEDLLVKGKFTFLNKQLKLSAKTKFNSEGGLKASSDYTLTHTVSPLSSYMVIHKPGNVTFDGNFKLWAQDKTLVTLYSNLVLTQTASKRELPSKLHVRVHHEDNKIFSVGVEKLDALNCRKPDVFSAWGLFGHNLQAQGVKVYAGPYLGFQLSTKALLFQKYLLGLKHGSFVTFLEAGLNRKVIKEKAQDGTDVSRVSLAKNVNVRFNGKVNKSLKVFGDLGYDFDAAKVDAKLVGEFIIDAATVVKARVQNDNSVTVGLNHNFRGLVNFGFTTRFEQVLAPLPKEGETSSSLSHVRCKFGLVADFNDTLV